jgi:hypothetical protein
MVILIGGMGCAGRTLLAKPVDAGRKHRPFSAGPLDDGDLSGDVGLRLHAYGRSDVDDITVAGLISETRRLKEQCLSNSVVLFEIEDDFGTGMKAARDFVGAVK